MFDFKFTEEQQMLREMVRDFTNNELKPIASKIDEEEKIPREIINKLGEHPSQSNTAEEASQKWGIA